jgi:hypothetical protein
MEVRTHIRIMKQSALTKKKTGVCTWRCRYGYWRRRFSCSFKLDWYTC